MTSFHLYDIYSSFPSFWEKIKIFPIKQQLERWKEEYMKEYPQLFHKLIDEYRYDGYNWKDIAEKYVFSKFPDNVHYFRQVGDILIQSIPEIHTKATNLFQIQFPINYVIYVGIGLGAGWADTYLDTPAVLFGIENVVECGWLDPLTLKALAAHEVGHVIHHSMRKSHELITKSQSPLWSLYEEGYAMRMEHQIMEYNSWHENQGQEGWLEWCQNNKQKLAKKFLHDLTDDKAELIRNYFGSWFDIAGYKQTGYYLGHEIIRYLEKQMKFEKIGILPMNTLQRKVREALELISRT